MLTILLTTFAVALNPPVTVEIESLPVELAGLRAREQVNVRVNENGREVVYAGVPLRVILGEPAEKTAMPRLRSLADSVLLVRARDDYQAAVSAAEVAMDTKGERFLLALTRDGKPLAEEQGPARLIVPRDPAHVRWVRMVSAIDLVRLPKAKATAAPARGNR